MKAVILFLSLAVTTNVFAYSAVDSTVFVSASPLLSTALTSGADQKLQANIILNDAQEFMLSGKMSVFLNQKIKDTQKMNQMASESDALEMLIDAASDIISE